MINRDAVIPYQESYHPAGNYYTRIKSSKMKKWSLLIFSVCLSLYTYAQQHAWKEMDRFDEQVDIILHPVETGNLHPVKANSAALLVNAKHWPCRYTTNSTKY